MNIEIKQQLGLPTCPYMERWVIDLGLFSIRIHHWRKSDDLRYYHNHPWWFLTFVMFGYYIDINPEGTQLMRHGCFAFRRANHWHSVMVPDGCWTVMLTGPQVQRFGFWANSRFRKASNYFHRFGHHPCSEGQKPVRPPYPKE